MERRHLEYFIAVVDAGSISGAARRMHLSQPAVSQGLKELERELRTPLVQRGRTATLTPAGRALVAPARRVLRAFDSARAATEQIDDLASGVLDIAVAPLFSTDAVPLIRRFRERHPGVRVRLHEAAPGAEGFQTLRRAEAELLICGQPAPHPKHRAVRLPNTRMMAVFPPGTEGLPEGDLSMEELVRHDFVLTLAQESAIRVWF
ncbi:LysR family transcriptional regulator, partial [Streptomyces albipurpureus]